MVHGVSDMLCCCYTGGRCVNWHRSCCC